MNMMERLNRELAYNAWANRETLRSVLAARNAPERSVAVLAHIVGAEWLWLARLEQPAPPMGGWPALQPTECDEQFRELSRVWQAYAGGLTSDLLEQQIRYTNTQGTEWSSAIADVLTHVVLHSSYHRGQIASLLGRAGDTAAYTDYIECVRQGYLERGWPA
jgi:uncharacterized damage-inducible protein DinB